jgi:YHS domain-containing protein
MKKMLICLILAVTLAFASSGAVWAAEQAACPVLGNKINKNIYTDYQGQRIYFCCPGCIEVFKKNPEAYLKKMRDQGVTPEKITTGGPTPPAK